MLEKTEEQHSNDTAQKRRKSEQSSAEHKTRNQESKDSRANSQHFTVSTEAAVSGDSQAAVQVIFKQQHLRW